MFKLFNQTYSNLEIIIINDGSDKKNLISFKIKTPKINLNKRWWCSSAEIHVESKGKYIAFIDADDVLPNKIEHQ